MESFLPLSIRKNEVQHRSKKGHQRTNGRWEGRYRPTCKFELIEDEVTIGAFRGCNNKDKKYKYEFLGYFDSPEEKDDAWMKSTKDDFARRKQESDPSSDKNKRKFDSNLIRSNPRKLVKTIDPQENVGLQPTSSSPTTVQDLPPTPISCPTTELSTSSSVEYDQHTEFHNDGGGVKPADQNSNNQIPQLSSLSISKAKVVWTCTVCQMCFDDLSEHSSSHHSHKASLIKTTSNNENSGVVTTCVHDLGNNGTKTKHDDSLNHDRQPPTTTKKNTGSEYENEVESDDLLDALFNWVAQEVTLGIDSEYLEPL